MSVVRDNFPREFSSEKHNQVEPVHRRTRISLWKRKLGVQWFPEMATACLRKIFYRKNHLPKCRECVWENNEFRDTGKMKSNENGFNKSIKSTTWGNKYCGVFSGRKQNNFPCKMFFGFFTSRETFLRCR